MEAAEKIEEQQPQYEFVRLKDLKKGEKFVEDSYGQELWIALEDPRVIEQEGERGHRCVCAHIDSEDRVSFFEAHDPMAYGLKLYSRGEFDLTLAAARMRVHVDKYKADWNRDPCWDLDSVDGSEFEPFRAELAEMVKTRDERIAERNAKKAEVEKRLGDEIRRDRVFPVFVEMVKAIVTQDAIVCAAHIGGEYHDGVISQSRAASDSDVIKQALALTQKVMAARAEL